MNPKEASAKSACCVRCRPASAAPQNPPPARKLAGYASYEVKPMAIDPALEDKKNADKAKEMIALYKEASKGITEAAVPGGVKKHK